ncbi:MAG: hypothetical protein COA79_19245 [Planctomycetota bacterium]|nr:MAG: hypothetical protein COA79_19245 [Planctomycetota bacterium]
MGATILLVDDDETIRDFLTEFLTLEGFLIVTAINGKEAMKVLSKQKIDLLITDLKMPEMDGLELSIKIKTDYPSLKVLGISGDDNPNEPDDFHELSRSFFDEFLLKPLDCKEILENINKLLLQ